MPHTHVINDTSMHPTDSSVSIQSTPDSTLKLWNLTFCVLNLLLFVMILVYGVITWKKIKGWRQFKNYIFLNVTASLILLNLSYSFCFMTWPYCSYRMATVYYLGLAGFANWVLIMCAVIYTKIVKVFSGDLQHKFLKANVFAWGMALGESALSTFVLCPTVLYLTHAMSYVILGFYLSIMYALLKLATVRMVSQDNSAQIMRIFLYVTSACAILTLLQVVEYYPDLHDIFFITVFACEIIYIVSFVTMKMHRDLWDEYVKRNALKLDVMRTVI